MWRVLARRALFSRRQTASQSLVSPVLHLQVSSHESVTLPSIDSVCGLSFFSTKSHVNLNLRIFSSKEADNYEEPPSELPISEGSGFDGGVDFSTMSEVGERAKSETESWDSVFNDVMDNFEVNEDLAWGKSAGSCSMGENSESVAIEDGDVRQGKENDPEKVESLLSLLQSRGTDDSGSLGSSFDGMDLVLDEEFVLKVLETPYIPGENLITFFRWVLEKPEFKLTALVLDALVSAICKENRKKVVYALWDLVREIGEKVKGVVSTKSLNELIAEFSRLGKGKAAYEVFNKFEEFGCDLNADTYYLTIEAQCKRSFYDWAFSVCENMLNSGKLPDADKVGKIISYLCRGGRPKDAYLVYLYAKDKNINLPRLSINFLIRALSRIEKIGEGTDRETKKELDKETVLLALEMLSDYPAEDRKYAIKVFSSVVRKLCWIKDVERAKKLLLEMIESGPPPGNDVFNCVINGLTKAGNIKEALNMKKLMEERGLRPDVYTYSVIIRGYASDGEMEKACKLLDEAKKQHSKLSPVSFHIVIRGFCRLEQFDKAVNLLGEMKQYGVKPCHDEYNKLIKSLCLTALDWETAEKLQEEMKENGMILNGRTRALIRAVKELKEDGSTPIPASA